MPRLPMTTALLLTAACSPSLECEAAGLVQLGDRCGHGKAPPPTG